MKIVDVHTAKSMLSKLLVDIVHGETVVIVRAGRPVARIVPYKRSLAPRHVGFGALAGAIVVPDDFDDVLDDEIVRDFGGDPTA